MKNKLIPFIILLSLIIIFANCNLAFSEWKDLDKIKVAIIELTPRVPDENIDTATITDLLQAELLDQNAFKIVERSLIDKILDEQKLQLSGLTNAQLVKIGELSGAQKIITGSISKLGDQYLILVKAIDISTGVIDFSEKISNESFNGLINDIPDLAAGIIRKVKGEPEPKVKQNTPEIENQAESQDEDSSLADDYAGEEDYPTDTDYLSNEAEIFGDKIYSYPENNYCYLSQEINVDSFMSQDKYAGLNLYLYDYYDERQPDELPFDIRKYDRLHLELESDHKGPFSLTLNQEYSVRMSQYIINYNIDDFNSYDLPLTSFKPWAGIKAADLGKIKTMGLCPQFFGDCRYTIRNIYFFNSKTKENYRLALTYNYTWKSDNSLSISSSANILEAELDYDPDLKVNGLGIILNSAPHDYHSTIDLSDYRKLILELKADAEKVDVTIDEGTPYRLTGVSNTYSTFTIPLDKLQGQGLYLAYSKELNLKPVTSKAGKLYVRNIRFE